MNTEFRKQAKSDFDRLLQADEQLGVRQDNGESAQPRGRKDCAGVGGKQDPPAGLGPVI